MSRVMDASEGADQMVGPFSYAGKLSEGRLS